MQVSYRSHLEPPALTRLLFVTTLFFTLTFAQEPQQTASIYRPTSNRQQPIIHPTRQEVLIPGSTYKIEWTPDQHFSNITLELWDKTSWGYSRDFGELCYHWVNPFCGTIVSRAPNTGSFEWHIPKPGSDFPRIERDFWIKMYVDDYLKPDIGNKDPVLSYSQNFGFAVDPGQSATISYNDATLTSSMPTISRSAVGLATPVTGIDTATVVGMGTTKDTAATSGVAKPNVSAKVVTGNGVARGTKLDFGALGRIGGIILVSPIAIWVFLTVI